MGTARQTMVRMQQPPVDDWDREVAIREVIFRLVHSLNEADAVDRFELRLRRLSREQRVAAVRARRSGPDPDTRRHIILHSVRGRCSH